MMFFLHSFVSRITWESPLRNPPVGRLCRDIAISQN
ncbi:hypothetical protein AFE_2521 [Acidithiobacillus ferrooxidans ATCC 23270]|uniref:Uncharacterized protein n=1 Tax=Acidithiobacillus ferrooxidans (strain ATCC 23270 / DSM 14882 / CIP 104768 / NCIMB 8455) TaxID=243159 RepID=B7J755_ACIF2|nr:hypothetical protein AFE_2521 [Acidithiobacillus ferrooxidans ATCC 23270]